MIAASRSRHFSNAARRCVLAFTLCLLGPAVVHAAGDLDTLLAPQPDGAGREPDVQPASLVAASSPGRAPDRVPLPVPLLPLGESVRGPDGVAAVGSAAGTSAPALSDWRVIAALGAAFALLASFKLFVRRVATVPPPDVFEVLGSAPLVGQHAVKILRFGPKTLLVGVSATGCTTLAEISDPQATARIAAACRGLQRAPRAAAGAALPGLRPAAARHAVRSAVGEEPATEPPATGDAA